MTTEHLIGYNVYPYLSCSCDTSIKYNKAELTQHLLDAGRATAKGELVTIDDPRIKPGARVRLEFVPRPRAREALEGVVERSRRWHLEACGWPVKSRSVSAIYLIAEAPDPDAEVRAALASVMGNGDPVGSDDQRSADDLLAQLRALNFEVVRKNGAS